MNEYHESNFFYFIIFDYYYRNKKLHKNKTMGNYLDYTTGMNYRKTFTEDTQACMYCKRAD